MKKKMIQTTLTDFLNTELNKDDQTMGIEFERATSQLMFTSRGDKASDQEAKKTGFQETNSGTSSN